MRHLVGHALVTTVIAGSLVYVAATISLYAFDTWFCVYGGAKNRGWV